MDRDDAEVAVARRRDQGGAGPEVTAAGPAAPTILHFAPGLPTAPTGPIDGRLVVILDTTWTGPAEGDPGRSVIGCREIAERVLAEMDLIEETSTRLDAWAERSGVVEAMTVSGTSFWYYGRLAHWLWLEDRILWLGIVDELVRTHPVAIIECAPGSDPSLVAAARAIAARDRLGFSGEDPAPETPADPSVVPTETARPPVQRATWRRIVGVAARWAGRSPTGPSSDPQAARRRLTRERLDRLAAEPGRPLLVLLQHARQRVDGPAGRRLINAYLGPVVDRLRGTPLEPIELDIRGRLDHDETWAWMTAPGQDRHLPLDVVWSAGAVDDHAAARRQADAAADHVAAVALPVDVFGTDVGPDLAARVAEYTRRSLAGQIVLLGRARHLISRLHPAGILLADEYHRQEWTGAARLEGVPSSAVQHGLIYRRHNGYIHRLRPTALQLPDRMYVFGDWERRLLSSESIYRHDEVSVSGSPRLDLTMIEDPAADAVDRAAVRAELGVRPGDRMLVLSGTWGSIYRRFHYPIALARLFDRPVPGVHLVVKLHPGEEDEGPYRAVVEGVAAAGGFAPPPITVIQQIDLYRLLRAADAHLGVHSTVLTEAVVTGTPNLLAAGLAGADLIGYVAAGVATPVRSGADLLAALDGGPEAELAERARRAFLEDHFRPGSASDRIATDLLERLR